MQIRLLLTGLIYQASNIELFYHLTFYVLKILFRKPLSSKQWISLLILTVGCMVHAAGSGSGQSMMNISDVSHVSDNFVQFVLGCVFILIQVLCSVFAGVYNEYIIKGAGADIHIMIQNVFMYLDSIICNVLLLSAKVRNELKHKNDDIPSDTCPNFRVTFSQHLHYHHWNLSINLLCCY